MNDHKLVGKLYAAYPELKIHEDEEYGTFKILDQRGTPFWLAFFDSELDALIAWDIYSSKIKTLEAEKEDMKRRNKALRVERLELIRRYMPRLALLAGDGPND